MLVTYCSSSSLSKSSALKSCVAAASGLCLLYPDTLLLVLALAAKVEAAVPARLLFEVLVCLLTCPDV